jgi:mannose-6-phosphate isomerase-like protein (cupin superfamily)
MNEAHERCCTERHLVLTCPLIWIDDDIGRDPIFRIRKQTFVADVVPGRQGLRHTHYEGEYVYILEGTLTVKPGGKDPITLRRGKSLMGHCIG